jgi:5-methylthioadenosine/S-adenosylhomocysteine deaminase
VGDTGDREVSLDALVESGLRGIAYQEVFGADERDWEKGLADLEAALERQMPRVTERCRLGVSPHAPYSVAAPIYRGVSELAIRRKLPMALHGAESRAETRFVRDGAGPFAEFLRGRGFPVRAMGSSTVEYLEGLGVLEARPLVIHAVQVDAADVERLRRSGSSVAHCPRSNARLGHGAAPVRAFLDAAVPVGLGTDGAPSCGACDLFEEARFAVLLDRARAGACGRGAGERDPSDRGPCEPGSDMGRCLDARAALELLTIGGARALGLADRIGSLEPGKLADLVAIDLSGFHHEPVVGPEESVVFCAHASDVSMTMVEGRAIFSGGACSTLDVGALRSRMDRAVDRIRRPS